jgi:hypothetical protein
MPCLNKENYIFLTQENINIHLAPPNTSYTHIVCLVLEVAEFSSMSVSELRSSVCEICGVGIKLTNLMVHPVMKC